jgi:hypothetical protein
LADWEQVAGIAVDSGIVWLGDPVYGLTPSAKEAPTEWKPFIAKAQSLGLKERVFAEFERSERFGCLRLLVEAGGSSGVFPVEVRRDPSTGLIVELRVLFE